MDLSWFLHTAWSTIVLGHPKDTKMQGDHKAVGCPHEGHVQGVAKIYPSEGFQMPLHYPRYKKVDYDMMEGWKVDMLLRQYGLNFEGTLVEKRAYAMGTFLWPEQL